jgi:dTDP-4-amino-4,6-dideoxygalactose transaminase
MVKHPRIGSSEVDQIPVFRPLIEQEELAAAKAALELGWLGMGSYVKEFEEALGGLTGRQARHVVAVSTGHAALHLAILASGVGQGDEVLTPSFNNIADFQAILATGATPVFCDIDHDTLCVTPESIERMIGPRTRAIIATDYFCHIANHDDIAAIARRHGLRLIHDAAHSLGSLHRGRPIGSFSDITIFSFDPVKSFTCIDGGAIIVNDDDEASKLREMRLIGMGQASDQLYRNQRAWTYDVARLGFRYHMANLHAAIGLAQLAKASVIAQSRREACQRYDVRLADARVLRGPSADLATVLPFLYYVRVQSDLRERFMAFLHERGVDTGIHWQPGHWFSLFRDCRKDGLEVTEQVGREIVSLPLHSRMALDTVERICDVVLEFDRRHR